MNFKKSLKEKKSIIIGTLIGFGIGLFPIILSHYVGDFFTSSAGLLEHIFVFSIAWLLAIAVFFDPSAFATLGFFEGLLLLTTWTFVGFLFPYLYLKWKKEQKKWGLIALILLIIIFSWLNIQGWIIVLNIRAL